ncbi:MAG TPA: DUF4476 domain-containing protein [Ferruginibacter sp.]|nr:DUF4476 domain-containing protein [Ferruginibacter sp.]
MRNLFLFVLTGLFLCTGFSSRAQDTHFLYIQSESESAFFAQYGEQLVSTTSGYLILSKLKPGIFNIEVGFPKNKYARQRFEVTLDKDKGFQLRHNSNGTWELYDWSTQQTITSTGNNVIRPVSKASEPIPTPEKATNQSAPIDQSDLKKAASPDAVIHSSRVLRFDQQYRPGKRLIYFQVMETGGVDTVIIEMPLQELPVQTVQTKQNQPTFAAPEQKAIVPALKETKPGQQPAPVEVKSVSQEPVVVKEKKEKAVFDAGHLPSKNRSDSSLAQQRVDSVSTTQAVATEKVAVNKSATTKAATKNLPANCPAAATQNDFLQLRSRMARERTDDNMVLAARKFLLKKCISTEQVRNLTVLFLTDFGRYKFLDACYNYCSDPQQYPELETLLSEPYFVNRFKAMLR